MRTLQKGSELGGVEISSAVLNKSGLRGLFSLQRVSHKLLVSGAGVRTGDGDMGVISPGWTLHPWVQPDRPGSESRERGHKSHQRRDKRFQKGTRNCVYYAGEVSEVRADSRRGKAI